MEITNVIKQDVSEIIEDEIHGLLYCIAYSNVIVVNSFTGELVGKFLVGPEMEQFFFDENKELFIVKSWGSRFRAYKVNEYSKPLWKKKLKGDCASKYVYRDGKFYGIAEAYMGCNYGIRYFIFDIHTLEVKSEGHTGSLFSNKKEREKLKGEIHDIVESELAKSEQKSVVIYKKVNSEKYAQVPSATFLYANGKFDFVNMCEKFYIIPHDAEMPKDFTAAIEKDKEIKATLKQFEEHTVFEGCLLPNIKHGVLYCFNDDRVSVFDFNSGKFVNKTDFILPEYEKLSLTDDGEFAVFSNKGEYIIYDVNNFKEPYWKIDFNNCEGDYLSLNFLNKNKIYCDKSDFVKADEEVEEQLQKLKGENDGYDPSKYAELNKRIKTGNYDIINIPYKEYYFIADIKNRELLKTECGFVHSAIVTYYHIWGGDLNKNPPEFWEQALAEYEEQRNGSNKTKVPKKYKDAGIMLLYETENSEFLTKKGEFAVVPKHSKYCSSREISDTDNNSEEYVKEHGLTKEYVETHDPYEVIEAGYYWALESLEKKSKRANVSLYDYVENGDISDIEKILYAVGWAQIYSGDEGISGYFINGNAIDNNLLIEALKLIGATQTAKAAQKCLKAVEAYNKKQSASDESYERLTEKIEELWENADEEYTELAVEYLKKLI
jgi:hypothetical protein